MRNATRSIRLGCLMLPALVACGGGDDSQADAGGGSPADSGATAGVWTPVSRDGAPSEREAHTAVWTGDEMIVWGGGSSAPVTDGGRYSPLTDSWRAVSAEGAPAPRSYHAAVWTGDEMIVWGGFAAGPVGDGGRYDPAADTWRPVSAELAPSPRNEPVAVWTGSEMIVWGGDTIVDGVIAYLADGGRYDPVADAWQQIATAGGPPARSAARAAVWTGSEVFVWAIDTASPGGPELAARYSPDSDSWSPVSGDGAPSTVGGDIAWTGSHVIVFGADEDGEGMTGALYDPASDSWSAMSVDGAPPEAFESTAVWTGSQFIQWGGNLLGVDGEDEVAIGGIYTVASDSWVATASPGDLAARSEHSAVWTGTEMIVWGGFGRGGAFSDGARFRP